MRERKRVCVCVCVTSAGMEAQYVFSEIIHIISANSSNVTTRIAYVKHLQLNPITSAQASSCKISFYIYSRCSDKCFQIYFNNIDIYNKCQFPNGNSFFGACHATSQISRWRLTGLIRREFGQTRFANHHLYYWFFLSVCCFIMAIRTITGLFMSMDSPFESQI